MTKQRAKWITLQSQPELLNEIDVGELLWPTFWTADNLVGIRFCRTSSGVFAVKGNQRVSGPFSDLESAIRQTGETAPLVWLDGEKVLLHEMVEPDDGRSSTKYVAKLKGSYIAVDMEGETLAGPYRGLYQAASWIDGFVVTPLSRSISSPCLSVGRICEQLTFLNFDEFQDEQLLINGEVVHLRDVRARPRWPSRRAPRVSHEDTVDRYREFREYLPTPSDVMAVMRVQLLGQLNPPSPEPPRGGGGGGYLIIPWLRWRAQQERLPSDRALCDRIAAMSAEDALAFLEREPRFKDLQLTGLLRRSVDKWGV